MPISGVMREILDREGGSIKGDEDFFSVARTIPLVAVIGAVSLIVAVEELHHVPLIPSAVTPWLTAFKAYSSIVSIDVMVRSDGPYQSAPAFRCKAELAMFNSTGTRPPYLGENVVKENEYLSAMIRCQYEHKQKRWKDQKKGAVGRWGVTFRWVRAHS
jgi:hypothetical protein